MQRISFDLWMKQVDSLLIAQLGMSSMDIADCNYAVWYDDGLSAKNAASRAIKENGGF